MIFGLCFDSLLNHCQPVAYGAPRDAVYTLEGVHGANVSESSEKNRGLTRRDESTRRVLIGHDFLDWVQRTLAHPVAGWGK